MPTRALNRVLLCVDRGLLMHCVYRSFDHTEAEIVASLLRAEGCLAEAFENGLSRLYWSHVIAFGGSRVMVSNEHKDAASEVMTRYQNGEYLLEDSDDLLCPRCGSANVEENPNYRGWAFVLGSVIGLPLFWFMKWRERCKSCGYHWKATPLHTYAKLEPPAVGTKVSSAN